MLGVDVDEAEIILEELYDASLVLQPSPGRYRLHDLVRVHARKLADARPEEAAQARRRVLELYVQAGRATSDDGRASDGDPQRFDSARDAARWLDAAGADLADVPKYAAAHGEDVLATHLGVALRDYFLHHDRYDEGRTALTPLHAAERSGDPALRAQVAASLGLLDYQQGRHAQGGDWFRQALKSARESGDETLAALALTGVATQDFLQGQHDMVTATMDEVLPVLKRAGDEWGVSQALALRSFSRFMQGAVRTAFADARAGLAAAESNGRPIPISQRLIGLADGHAALGERAEARAVLLRSEALLQGRRSAAAGLDVDAAGIARGGPCGGGTPPTPGTGTARRHLAAFGAAPHTTRDGDPAPPGPVVRGGRSAGAGPTGVLCGTGPGTSGGTPGSARAVAGFAGGSGRGVSRRHRPGALAQFPMLVSPRGGSTMFATGWDSTSYGMPDGE